MINAGRPLFRFADGEAADAYRQRMLQAMALPAPKRGAKALDLGCGGGEEAAKVASLGYQVEAVDLEAGPLWERLAKAHKGRLRFKVIKATAVPRASAYDVVVAKDMLHHADDPVKVLKGMLKAVKPGGRVMVVEANRLNPVFYLHLTLLEGHQHFTLWRLRSLLAQAGMTGYALKRVEARVWPLNRTWAQRLVNAGQDLLQALPLWMPFVCYHVISWQRPLKGKTRAA